MRTWSLYSAYDDKIILTRINNDRYYTKSAIYSKLKKILKRSVDSIRDWYRNYL